MDIIYSAQNIFSSERDLYEEPPSFIRGKTEPGHDAGQILMHEHQGSMCLQLCVLLGHGSYLKQSDLLILLSCGRQKESF